MATEKINDTQYEQEYTGLKYYYLRYKYLGVRRFSIGDNVQSIAVKNMLSKMGIAEKDMLPINRDDLALDHPGIEKGIFISQGWFGISPETNPLPITDPNLTPLYFGFYLNEGSWQYFSKNAEFIQSMIKYEPIGCRDFGTRDFLRTLGIKAYFSGCLTMTFDKRDKTPNTKKTFLIDALEEVNEFLPDDMKKNMVNLSQEGEFPSGIFPVCDEDVAAIDNIAYERLEQLKTEATFVVTRRIHTAMPCIAMGIPVVFAFTQLNNPRISIIKNYLPVYDEGTCQNINWNVTAPDTESLKYKMWLMFTYRLQILENMLGIHTKRLSVEDMELAEKLIENACIDNSSPLPPQSVNDYCKSDFLDSLFNNEQFGLIEKSIPLVLFGAGSAGKHLTAIMKYFGINPNYICDNNAVEGKEDYCQGVPVITFDTLKKKYKNSVVFITTIKGMEPIYQQLMEHGFDEKKIIKNESLIQKYAHFLVPSDMPYEEPALS